MIYLTYRISMITESKLQKVQKAKKNSLKNFNSKTKKISDNTRNFINKRDRFKSEKIIK